MSVNKPYIDDAQNFRSRMVAFLRNRKLDVFLLSIIMIIAGTVSAVNMSGYPQRFEDEGTYISQAWAIQERGTLTHYTYWYDHPPVGWIQIAGYVGVTNAFERHDSAVVAGREFMLVLHVLSVGLLFSLARRIGLGTIAASTAALLYSLSPLSVEFGRYVLLDNVALPWLLGAFLLALSPRKHLSTAIGSAVCMAIAVLSKETFLALMPVLAYGLWRTSDPRNRRYIMVTFAVVFGLVSGFYVLYAALKSELVPGEGHVSLLGTFFWQLFGREGSGSILDSSSANRGLVTYWLDIDSWLLLAGTIVVPIALFFKKLRMVSAAMIINLLLLLRTGYLPYPYIIIMLPFAALTLSGVIDAMIIQPIKSVRLSPKIRIHAMAAAAVLVIGVAMYVAPDWQKGLQPIVSVDNDLSSREAVSWMSQNIPTQDRLVIESALWTDLLKEGYDQPEPVWLYKTETDPEVVKDIGGWRGVDYVALNGPTVHSRDFTETFPTVSRAINNAELVKEFGANTQKIYIYKVTN